MHTEVFAEHQHGIERLDEVKEQLLEVHQITEASLEVAAQGSGVDVAEEAGESVDDVGRDLDG